MGKPARRVKSRPRKARKAGHPGRRARAQGRRDVLSPPVRVVSSEDQPPADRLRELQRDYTLLREKAAGLEDRVTELTEAHEELRRAYGALRDRAGVIEQRYSELVERVALAAPPRTPGSSAAQPAAPRNVPPTKRPK